MTGALEAEVVLERSEPGDRYADFCLWDYRPAAPTAGKLRGASVLWHALAVAGASPKLAEALRHLRRELGPFRTVWGVKQAGGRLSFEFYFYDYERLEREVSLSRVLAILSPHVRCSLPPPEERPYFMFSFDLDDAIVDRGAPLAAVDIYVGNPGSSVSSGICHRLTARGLELRNFYFFFDAATEMEDVRAKVATSAFLDLPKLALDEVLWPEMLRCKTIVVANKRANDGVYFCHVTVGQLLYALRRTDWPASLLAFIEAHRNELDHLLFDVGVDYVMRDGAIAVEKSAFYGIL